ncbi:MAG TPA: FAD synthetase family protein [Candidatus Limnocylindrales bacterium]|nr:FAD synthetase family protein [Candidatus Limnocylindrales bacterium]
MAEPDVVAGIGGLESRLGRLLITVGVFDGLHRGHAYLLRHLVDEARALGARPTILTFDAHPDAIVRGEAPPLLLDPEERLVRLARAGVEVVVVVHFDDALRHTPYDAFVRSIGERVELAGFVMTPDAAFGFERRGTPEALSALAARGDTAPAFHVVVVPPFLLEGRPVRSSDIREAVAGGRLDAARRLLGRRHAVTGIQGDDGRLATPMPVALPPAGRYAAAVTAPWTLAATPAGRPRGVSVAVGQDGRIVVLRSSSGGPVQPPGPDGRPVRIAFVDRSG